MKTEPNYEVNQEKLSDLSISDVISLINYYEAYRKQHWEQITDEFHEELDKRINNIIIF